jgi:hypothetical protein
MMELRRQLFLPSTESLPALKLAMDLRYSGASPVKHLNTNLILNPGLHRTPMFVAESEQVSMVDVERTSSHKFL